MNWATAFFLSVLTFNLTGGALVWYVFRQIFKSDDASAKALKELRDRL